MLSNKTVPLALNVSCDLDLAKEMSDEVEFHMLNRYQVGLVKEPVNCSLTARRTLTEMREMTSNWVDDTGKQQLESVSDKQQNSYLGVLTLEVMACIKPTTSLLNDVSRYSIP